MNCKNYEPVEEVHTSCDGCAKFMTTCPADNDVYPRKCWTPKQPEPDAPVKHFSCKGCGKDPCNCQNYEPVEEVHTSCDGCAKFMTTCPADNDVYPRKCWTPKQPEPDAPVKHFSCKGCGKDPCNERRECFYDIGGECNGGLRRYWTPAQLEPHLSCDGCTGREGYECVDCIPDPGDETRKNWTEIQNWMAPWSSSKQTQVMVADPVDGIAAVTERNNKEQK